MWYPDFGELVADDGVSEAEIERDCRGPGVEHHHPMVAAPCYNLAESHEIRADSQAPILRVDRDLPHPRLFRVDFVLTQDETADHISASIRADKVEIDSFGGEICEVES